MRNQISLFIKIFFLCIVAQAGCLSVHGQSERTALNRLQDGKWESAHKLLKKSLQKEATGVEGNYVMAHWFVALANPSYQLDSAYRYINRSIFRYDTLAQRDRDRLLKFPIDSVVLLSLRQRIDSLAFAEAKDKNTEESYKRFLSSFPYAQQKASAIELRDEVSYLEALKVNTYQSYFQYMEKYPQSQRMREAKDRYEKLLFEEKTRDKKLKSYELFIQQYPSNPFAREAHKQVFEISTASGEPQDFLSYIKKYPSSRFVSFARDIVFHVFEDTDEKIPAAILNDSLNTVMKLNASYWVPYLKDNKFGFMDEKGSEVLPAEFQNVREAYKCGPVKDDILFVSSGLMSRSGELISKAAEVNSIGLGFLVESGKGICHTLIHKSGRVIIATCYEEFKVVGTGFLAARKEASWDLYALTGRLLLTGRISDVQEMEDVIVITRLGKKIATTSIQLAALADGKEFQDDLVFDEIMAVDKGMLLVRNGGLEGIIDSKLKFVVPLDRHLLTKTPFGLIEKRNDQYTVRGLSTELESKTWDYVRPQGEWLVLTKSNVSQLFHVPAKRIIETQADSIWFDRGLAFVHSKTGNRVHFSGSRSLDLEPDSKIRFIPSRDSVLFFFTEVKNKRKIFSLTTGSLLFTTDYEVVESFGKDFFMVTKGNKKGIVGRDGKERVPVEMDAIILTGTTLSLLKDRRFGLFDLTSHKLIKPIYERNVSLLGEHLAVYKDGFYGLIGWDAKPVTPFEYLEIKPWSDSVLWVKKNAQWILLNYVTHETVMDKVREFTTIKDTEAEKLMIVHRDNYYGVISNRKGVIIPPTFTDLVNLGTAETPFYFTEKHVEEAAIFIVIYYDQHGRLVRRQALEEDEYDRIFCEDH